MSSFDHSRREHDGQNGKVPGESGHLHYPVKKIF